MKTGPRVHWRVCSFIRMNDNYVPIIKSSLLNKKNRFILFPNDDKLLNQFFDILPSQNNIVIGNNENRPRGPWWVCNVIRMNDNLIPKIQSSLLVKRNWLISFLIILSISTYIFSYYLLKTTFLVKNYEDRPHSTLMSL